jgi:hypothetical protein
MHGKLQSRLSVPQPRIEPSISPAENPTEHLPGRESNWASPWPRIKPSISRTQVCHTAVHSLLAVVGRLQHFKFSIRTSRQQAAVSALCKLYREEMQYLKASWSWHRCCRHMRILARYVTRRLAGRKSILLCICCHRVIILGKWCSTLRYD